MLEYTWQKAITKYPKNNNNIDSIKNKKATLILNFPRIFSISD